MKVPSNIWFQLQIVNFSHSSNSDCKPNSYFLVLCHYGVTPVMPLPVTQSNLHRKYRWLCAPTPPRGKSCKRECWAERARAGSSEGDGAYSAQNQTEPSKFLWLRCIYAKAKLSPVCFIYQTNGKIYYHRVLILRQRRGSMSELSGTTVLKLHIYINLTDLWTSIRTNEASFLTV